MVKPFTLQISNNLIAEIKDKVKNIHGMKCQMMVVGNMEQTLNT